MTKTTSDYTGQKLEPDTDFNNTSVLTSAWTLCMMLEWLYNHIFFKLITFSSFFHFLFCNWSLPDCLKTFGIHTSRAQIQISMTTKTASLNTWLWHCDEVKHINESRTHTLQSSAWKLIVMSNDLISYIFVIYVFYAFL